MYYIFLYEVKSSVEMLKGVNIKVVSIDKNGKYNKNNIT